MSTFVSHRTSLNIVTATMLFLLAFSGAAQAQLDGRIESNDNVVSKKKGATVSAATAPAAAAAILTPAAASFNTSVSITGASAPNSTQAHVFTSGFHGFPTNGNSFLVLSSGLADLTPGVATTFESHNLGGPTLPAAATFASPDGLASYDVVTLKMTFALPVGTDIKLGFDWKFASEEVPQYETAFKDYFRADLFTSSSAHIANIAMLPDNTPVTAYNMVNGGFCNIPGGNSSTPTAPFPSPNDVVYNAVTNFLGHASIDLSAYSGQTVTLLIRVADVNDAVLNSAAFIDNLDITYNQYPVAQCQSITVPADANCQANVWPSQVDGGSYDPENGPLTFSLSPAGPYALGSTPVTLTVTDDKGASASCDATVTVVDAAAPSIICPGNISVNNDPNLCTAVVTFVATASDNCSTPSVVCVPASGWAFPLGSTTVTCTATDPAGNASSCSFIVSVSDVTPPMIAVTLNPTTLWPPNHTMKTINATITVSDNCPGATWVLTSITSNESDNGLGDGDQPNDIQNAAYGTADTQFKLRAERSGTGNGRTYTVTYTATDGSGNSSTATATVTVPKNLGKPSLAGTDIPASLLLEQNYPNPFNPSTVIKYGVPENGNVLLEVFDMNSRLVATLVNESQQAGMYTLQFDASALSSGAYIAKLSMNGAVTTRSMNLVK